MGEGHTEPTGGDRRRLTVPEAAAILGMTVDAVRGKVRRGTLDSEREGGTVYVYVDTDGRGQPTTVEGPSPVALVEELRDRVSYLERQVEEEREARRRADTILAQLSRANEEQARTIRALEAPASEVPETQNQAESAEPRSDRVETSEATEEPEKPTERRSLWRRIFGG